MFALHMRVNIETIIEKRMRSTRGQIKRSAILDYTQQPTFNFGMIMGSDELVVV